MRVWQGTVGWEKVLAPFAFSALTLLFGWQEGHPARKKTEWWGVGMVICLERGADLPLNGRVCVCTSPFVDRLQTGIHSASRVLCRLRVGWGIKKG